MLVSRTCFFLCTALAGTTIVIADQPQTHFVLTRPARIPGLKLKSGSYTVRILDRLADRYILEIGNDRDSKALTTFLAVPDENLPRLTDGTPVYWSNSGRTPAIRGMWIAGAPAGAEFVFPKAEAAALAKQVRQPVPAIDPDSEGKQAVAKMSDSDRQIVTLWLLSAVSITPEGSQTGIQAAKFVPTPKSAPPQPEVQVASARESTREKAVDPAMKMPKTAGSFAADLIAGLLCVGLGMALFLKIKLRAAT